MRIKQTVKLSLLTYILFILISSTARLSAAPGAAVSITQNVDTNFIVKVVYPPLTEREGKGLDIPIPPVAHPRLFLTRRDIPEIIEKLKNPLFAECSAKILNLGGSTVDGILKTVLANQGNLDLNVRGAIEAKALLYVLHGDKAIGHEAVKAILDFYATLKFDINKPDLCRDIGRAIVTGAVVYDWCYPLITQAQKAMLIARMETLATRLEVKWPNLVQGSVVGHGTEAQLSRDMLACGVATYNEKPQVYNLVAGRILAEFAPARHFFYPAGYHHQGSSYGLYRFNWDMYDTFIFDKLGYPNIFGSDQSKVPYFALYSRRPDGQLMRNGDDYNELYMPFGKFWDVGLSSTAFAGSYFKDPILINEALKEQFIGQNTDYIFDLLFYNSHVPVDQTKATLPLTRYFKEPFGTMVARTGWEDGLQSSAVVTEMKVGVYNFANHEHEDAGSFQIYYKGPLTVQSGIYQGVTGGYGSAHFLNYSQRSIAHNTMLVYDPDEKFYWHNNQVLNDGGQKLPNHAEEPNTLNALLDNPDYKVGQVLAHAFGPDSLKPEFSYLKGQLAPAYSAKVRSFERSFVFLNLDNTDFPAALLVFDNLKTTHKDFKNYWLLHSVEEPTMNGNKTTIARTEKGYNGKLINTTLLPIANNLIIDKVGGKDNAYNVFGKNFPQAPANISNSADSAMWRIAVSPKTGSTDNLFLNVMQVTDNGPHRAPIPAVTYLENEEFSGAQLGNRVVFFGKKGIIVNKAFKININGKGIYKVLITDVATGNWEVRAENIKSPAFKVVNDNNLLYFTAEPGIYSLSKR